MKNSLIVIAALVFQVLPVCAEDGKQTRPRGDPATATVDQIADAGRAGEPAVTSNIRDRGGAVEALASVMQIGGERGVPPERRGGSTELVQDADAAATGVQLDGTAWSIPDPCQPGLGCAVISGVWPIPRYGASSASAVQQAGPLISQR